MMSDVPYKTLHITAQQQNQTHFCSVYDKQEVVVRILNVKNGSCDSDPAPMGAGISFRELGIRVWLNGRVPLHAAVALTMEFPWEQSFATSKARPVWDTSGHPWGPRALSPLPIALT